VTFFGVTLLTAAGTVVLAVFAIFTAWYARKAFLKQSEEVTAIERQVADEQEVTRQQAELIKIQSGQLQVFRAQLEDQKKASEKQAAVLDLQAKDLYESIGERRRLRKATERAQADEIDFLTTAAIKFPHIAEEDGGGRFAVDPSQTVHLFVVSNESRRPIKKVECKIGGASGADSVFPKMHSDLAVIVGRLAAPDNPGREGPRLVDPVPRFSARQILPREKYGFVFEVESHRDLALSQVAVSFTDDAGLRWQIDQYQHLERLPDGENEDDKGSRTP